MQWAGVSIPPALIFTLGLRLERAMDTGTIRKRLPGEPPRSPRTPRKAGNKLAICFASGVLGVLSVIGAVGGGALLVGFPASSSNRAATGM